MTKNTVTGKTSAVTGRPTDFSKIDIRDDMMFCSVFHNPEDCREFLQRIMGIRIAELRIVQEQKSMQSRYQGKGVRLDIYVRDVEGNSYDIEMQMINTGELPLRSRYYHSQMDIYQIQGGQTYMELQKSMVIFVCGFDMFGQGKSIYSFETVCRGEKDIVLPDKRETLFVNIGGDRTGIGQDTAALLDYFQTGSPTDAFTRGLQDKVEKIRDDTEWRENYMTYDMKIKLEAEVRAKGMAEGMAKEMAVKMAEEKAKEMAVKMAEEKAKEMAVKMAEEKAKEMAVEMAEEKAKEMAVEIAEKQAAEERAEGEKIRDKKLIAKWLQKGKTVQEIAENLDESEAYVRELMQEEE